MDLPAPAPAEIRGYISDMLSELADLAKDIGETRMERSIRILALDVLARRAPDSGDLSEADER